MPKKLKKVKGNLPDEKKPYARHAGWDVFMPDPGEHEDMFCRVCKTKMDVERNLNGPTGFAEAMAKRGHLHDRFSCPNGGQIWHNQVIALKEAISDTPSLTIAKILENEVELILSTHKPTKDEFKGKYGIF